MKKIIFLLLFITFYNANAQCVIDGVTLVGPGGKSTIYKACDMLVQSLSDGMVKSHGDSLKTAVAGTDYQAPISLTTTGTSGAATLSGTTLNIPQYGSGSGSVSSVSLNTANGFSGSVTNPTSTPAITISTNVNGIVKGNGTAVSAATAGSDYSAGTSSNTTGIVKSTTGTGALTTAVAADFPTLNQSTTGSAATLSTPRTINGVSFNGSSNITVLDASKLAIANNLTDVNSKLKSLQNIGGAYSKVVKLSANATIDSSYRGQLLDITTSTSALTITLGTTCQVNGFAIFIRKADATTGTVTVSPTPANGAPLLGNSGHSMLVWYDGTQFNQRCFYGGFNSAGDLSISSIRNINLTPGAVDTVNVKGRLSAVNLNVTNIINGSISGTSSSITSSPDYFYTGYNFYKSRVGTAFLSPFPNTPSATNTPTNIVFIGDSRLDFNIGNLVDMIGQYDKINSLGFISFFINTTTYGSDCIFANTGTAATLTRNDVTSNATWGISGGRADCTTGAIWTIAPVSKYRFDSFQLWYNRTSGGGSFTYTIDGGSATTVNTTAVSDSLGTLTVNTGLATGGTHTIVLTVTSGSVRFYGIDFYNKAQAGYCVQVLNSGGSTSAQWDGHNLYTKQYIAAKNPVLCNIWLGTNDAGDLGAGSSASVYIGHIKNIISQLNLPNKCAVVLMSDPVRGLATNNTLEDTATTTLLKSYRNALIQAVSDSGYSLFDEQKYWPSYSYGWTNGMYSDNIHPSSGGATYTWNGLVRAIMPALNNESSAGLLTKRRTSILVPTDGVTGFGAVAINSNGIQSENFTGHYFPSNGQMNYLSGNTKYISYSLGSAIMTAYPTSTYSQVLFGYRQGSTSNKCFDLSVTTASSLQFTLSNAPLLVSGTYLASSNKFYSGSISVSPTALIHTAAGTATSTTAPIKLTPGVILTTPEAGAIESDANNQLYHSTNTTSNSRGFFVISKYVAKTGAYTLTSDDLTVDCTSGTFTVTLPTAVGISGRIYHIVNSGTGTITVATTSSQTISGSSTNILNTQNSHIAVMSTGANWIIISN